MAIGDPANSIRIAGQLIKAPTLFTEGDTFPFTTSGAVQLGLVRDIEFRPEVGRRFITGEEFGGEVTEVVRGGTSGFLFAVLVGWDKTLLNQMFLQGGGADTHIVSPGTGDFAAGKLGSNSGLKLMFFPRNDTNHPALVMFNAIPMPDEAARMSLNINADMGLPVVFYGIRNDASRMFEAGDFDEIGAGTAGENP